MVHLDIKSHNVLLWYFPSPHEDRQERINQSVLLKITDYGISQVSSKQAIRVDISTALSGTSGYMAPELFKIGKTISAEKVSIYCIAGWCYGFSCTFYYLEQNTYISSAILAGS